MVVIASQGSLSVPTASATPRPAHYVQTPAFIDEDLDVSPGSETEDPVDIDQDVAQSFFQPALSPAATRLTSPSTPAAEKAAAMNNELAGDRLSVVPEAEGPSPPSLVSHVPPPFPAYRATSPTPQQTKKERRFTLGPLPPNLPYLNKLPSPWVSGPKELVVENDSGHRSALSTVFGQGRQGRSSSGGADTLKRLRDALPSISLSSFFSGPSTSKAVESDQTISSHDGSADSKQVLPPSVTSTSQDDLATVIGAGRSNDGLSGVAAPSSLLSVRPRAIRRSTSDESMLYHSLSRMSSYDDEERWSHVREQRNSRLKAITDSWDRPTFKLPQLPNIISAPLKRHPQLGLEGSEAAQEDQLRSASLAVKDANLSELDRALESLTGDVVIMGGYRGSVLRSTRTKRQVWVPVKVGLNIRKVNLEVGLHSEDEERMEETIYPSGMLQNIGPVDISRRLFKKLRECENAKTGKLRVWDYGYDWRLSPHILSRKLINFLQSLPSNQGSGDGENRGATVISHSLGGLITRHAVNQRPELFSGVIFAGTPQRCINILGPFRNGDAVLFNEKVLTAHVNFSLRTSFVFLPEDGFCFINKHSREEYPVDFYDAKQWVKYALSPCVAPALPAYNRSTPRASLRELSERLPSPLRSRGNSTAGDPRHTQPHGRNILAEAVRKFEVSHDHSLAPQMGTSPSDNASAQNHQQLSQNSGLGQEEAEDRNMAYLTRTLAEIKQFRAETYHQPRHSESNSYPPLAVIYGRDIPTVWAAHVSSRDAIACSDAYDDLLFRSGDGVVLAKEAMLPEGYELVRGGRVSSDRGHITLLGDLEAVGKALQAVTRGRRKGIGLGRDLAAWRKNGAHSSRVQT
ncbi:hypothetical protein F5Y17DRAFT_431637 [Xylariaceae sp. FL0594]|nr:hypothetical protein F5Y17DRAFT_431637 [Xylariaceae sp. FL0594]